MTFLITAGPTREPIDPVRYLSNRSSGRMGFALADAAAKAGHRVLLIAGPTSLATPAGVTRIDIETAQQMFDAVQKHIATAQAAIFAAAVADYRPITSAANKIKKDNASLTLELERTPDILGSARSVFHFTGLLIGFAAETENLIENAKLKLTRKHCDLIIANDVSDPSIGFDSTDNQVTLCHANGLIEPLPKQPKQEIARKIVASIEALQR